MTGIKSEKNILESVSQCSLWKMTGIKSEKNILENVSQCSLWKTPQLRDSCNIFKSSIQKFPGFLKMIKILKQPTNQSITINKSSNHSNVKKKLINQTKNQIKSIL